MLYEKTVGAVDSRNVIDAFLDAVQEIGRALPRKDIERVVDMLYEAWSQGRAVFTMGNGGSASTATHLACDLAKCTMVPGRHRLKAMALVDNVPLVSAWTNDSGFGSIFAEQLEPWLQEGDVVIGLSVHGCSGAGDAGPWSQNLLRAVRLAKDRGAKVIGFSGFDGGALREMADVCLVIPIDDEPLGTPLVESCHVLLHHLICTALRLRIAESSDE
jgi:D-sedoheptulose 7-phosphate isomerase